MWRASSTPAAKAQVRDLVQEAKADLRRQKATRILIIEDEPVIALDLASTVEQAAIRSWGSLRPTARRWRWRGAIARPRARRHPAGRRQLRHRRRGRDPGAPIPVIFITAFPERLLTGDRPEPAFLIRKPFDAEMLSVTISQALVREDRAADEAAERPEPGERRRSNLAGQPLPRRVVRQPAGSARSWWSASCWRRRCCGRSPRPSPPTVRTSSGWTMRPGRARH